MCGLIGQILRVALLLLVGLAAPVFGDEPQGLPHPWSTVTADRLLKPDAGDWTSYRRTYDATGFSPLRQIDRRNVKQLRAMWTYSVRDTSRWVPTPLAVNGFLYVVEGGGRVLAFDAATGDPIWIHERRYPNDISISQGFNRARGISIYGDVLYWGTADARLVALNAQSGKLLWEVETGDYHTGYGHNHPALIAEGKVFLGHAGGDRGVRSRFRAFDPETGKLLWTVNTTPEPGEPGFETWPSGPFPPLGAAPWNTPSYDPDLRLVFFGTGQPSPWSTAVRGNGDALYANTVMAVEAATGKVRWHYQMVPADNWDRAVYESMLVDLDIKGRKRKALIVTSKVGWGVVLDRATGEFIHAFKTAYDNVITGWTKQGRPVVNPASVPKPEDLGTEKVFEICPHFHGARNLQAPSYSPITKLYYLGVNNTCMDARVRPMTYTPGESFMSATAVPAQPKRAPGYEYVGEFVALNPVTGERAWAYRAPGGAAMTASALATAGGIVFGGTADRGFFALDAESGALLWQTRLNGDVSGAPVTFAVNGRQYVAIGAGGRPAPATSFSRLTNVHLAEGSGAVWVFALPDERDLQHAARRAARPVVISSSGVAMPAPPSPATAGINPDGVQSGATPAGTFTEAQAAQGEQVFGRSCATCHPIATQTGESFRAKWTNRSVAELFNLVSATMPESAPGSLSGEDYAAVIAFLLKQSGYPAGLSRLPADRTALSRISIEPLGNAH